MNVDMLNLRTFANAESKPAELAKITFRNHVTANPVWSIWTMTAPKAQPIFKWWGYDGKMDEDANALNQTWNVSGSQSLFDALFFDQLKKIFPDLYVIFPGYLRYNGIDKLRPEDKAAFLKGQGCSFHLEGAFDGKLKINWVPFGQPHAVVRAPSFWNMWRIFQANPTDDATNNISFFSLKDTSLLPKVLACLITEDDNRSEKLAQIVDWFGLYNSPRTDENGPCAVFYTKNKESITQFNRLEKQVEAIVAEARTALHDQTTPQTVIKLLTRSIAL